MYLGWAISGNSNRITSKFGLPFFSFSFKILSSFCVVDCPIMMCLGKDVSSSYLFGVLNASCIWISTSFLSFGKLSDIILLKILCISLVCFLVLSTQKSLGFGLLMLSPISCILWSWSVIFSSLLTLLPRLYTSCLRLENLSHMWSIILMMLAAEFLTWFIKYFFYRICFVLFQNFSLFI